MVREVTVNVNKNHRHFVILKSFKTGESNVHPCLTSSSITLVQQTTP